MILEDHIIEQVLLQTFFEQQIIREIIAWKDYDGAPCIYHTHF